MRRGNFGEYLAILPSLTDEGKRVAKLIGTDGEVYFSKTRFDTTLNNFLLSHGVSMQTKLLPIYVGQGHVLIPFAMVVPGTTGEIANGYVFHHGIKSLVDTSLLLTNGVTLETCNSPHTLHQRRLLAESVLDLFESHFRSEKAQRLCFV